MRIPIPSVLGQVTLNQGRKTSAAAARAGNSAFLQDDAMKFVDLLRGPQNLSVPSANLLPSHSSERITVDRQPLPHHGLRPGSIVRTENSAPDSAATSDHRTAVSGRSRGHHCP